MLGRTVQFFNSVISSVLFVAAESRYDTETACRKAVAVKSNGQLLWTVPSIPVPWDLGKAVGNLSRYNRLSSRYREQKADHWCNRAERWGYLFYSEYCWFAEKEKQWNISFREIKKWAYKIIARRTWRYGGLLLSKSPYSASWIRGRIIYPFHTRWYKSDDWAFDEGYRIMFFWIGRG